MCLIKRNICNYISLQILPDGEMKPQAKHLQTRSDYLLKVLHMQADLAAVPVSLT